MRVEQRAFTRQKLYPHDYDGFIFQQEMMVRLLLQRNGRLLRGNESGQHEYHGSA
ncbi:hypothetical protein SBA7_1110003 [Candidatus Sulfotelmatobacter sp. SbA7]|nr:hypothetical protein SBA7_1110003 [Candidatus Sulfotelmatobacter sp. SbA7]